jgi:Glycosyl transferases group 1
VGPVEKPTLRVLHLPVNPDGVAWANVQALRSRGVHAELAVYEQPAARPDADWAIDLPPDAIRGSAARLHVLLRFAPRVDVFHFYGQTLLPPALQFRALRLAHRRGVVQLVGADVRGKSSEELGWTARAPAVLVDSYDTARVLPGAHVVPPAIALETFVPVPPRARERPLVLAAPTAPDEDRVLVAAACESLGAEPEFLDPDLHHEQAFDRCRRADVVVDDLASGWYGTFAIEAMALGKPVVAALNDDARRRTEQAHGVAVPVVSATRETLVEVLRPLLGDPAEQRRVGGEGRAFVERVHDPNAVADRLLDVYARL